MKQKLIVGIVVGVLVVGILIGFFLLKPDRPTSGFASRPLNPTIGEGDQNIIPNSPTSDRDQKLDTVQPTSETNAGDSCGHNIDLSMVSYGYNAVVDESGNIVEPQGKPFQEGYKLTKQDAYPDNHNFREYAQIFVYMGQIRDALICDLNSVSQEEWDSLTEILTLNNIKQTQSLTGTPKEQFYSSQGIYEHLTESGEDFNPMMKFLEEAEIELKCLAFKDYDFTNPEGENHCEIYNLEQGSGLILPDIL